MVSKGFFPGYVDAKEKWPGGCLRLHHAVEPRGEAVDDRHDLVAARNSKGAEAKIVLHSDDDEDVVAVDGRGFAHFGLT